MAKKKALNPVITCEDCIHESACCAWTLGGRLATQNAEKCQFFETVRSSAAYLIGKMEADRWIPVEERLPEEKSKVLVFWFGNVHEVTYLGDGTFETLARQRVISGRDVTHWMPLPEPPKEE